MSPDRLLTPGKVAGMFGVDPKTVSLWVTSAASDPSAPGRHRRFRESEVMALLATGTSGSAVHRLIRPNPTAVDRGQ